MIKKILVVGQTPPPYGGQAVMIRELLNGHYANIKLYHIRMSFSKEMDQLGKVNIAKIIHLFCIIVKIYYYRFRYKINILYYPPSGPVNIAIMRDMFILTLTRWLFKKVVFQFFAGGITEKYSHFSALYKFFFRLSFFYPDIALRPSLFSPDDCQFIRSKKEYIVNWATEQNYLRYSSQRTYNEIPNILFVGVLKESKGIMVLLEACSIIYKKNIDFTVSIMGKFESLAFEKQVRKFIKNNNMDPIIDCLGVKTGDEYYTYFLNSSIFCFPTFFESENVPIVTIDACEFELPIVATKWRGVPSVVEDNVNGFLVPIKNAQAVADKLEILIKDPELMLSMGQKGRNKYLENFRIDIFYKKMNKVFNEL